MKHAFRQLLKTPGYTALAVIALALGIGANTAIFSAINTLFLRPLPYRQPAQLVRIYSKFPDQGLEQAALSWPRFEAIRDQQQVFSNIGALSDTGFTLTGRGDPVQVPARRITANFFPTLGITPTMGRTFTTAEDAPGGANTILISYAFWQKRLGGRPDVLGQSLVLDGRPWTVIGVLPKLPVPFDQTEIWAPRVFEQEGLSQDLVRRGTGYLTLFARLQPETTVARAVEQLRVIQSRYAAANPEKIDAKATLTVVSMQEDLVGGRRPMFLTLLAAVGCVLLVACANVANLLLARFTARRKEIAIRAALGASRGRIVVQFLTESLLTAALAGILGVVLAVWGLDVLAHVGERFIPRAHELHLDASVLGFAVALTLLTGLVLGLAPALQASRADAADALKDSTRGSTSGRQAGKFRAALLVVEVAVSLVLLVGAALLIDSFRRLQRVDPGFRADHVTTFFIGLPDSQYPTIQERAQFFENALEKIRAIPGVQLASATDSLPIVGGGTFSPIAVEGRPLPAMNDRLCPRRGVTMPGLFDVLGVPLKQGHDFNWRDVDGTRKVMIINEVAAKRLFPGENPIGRVLITGIQSVPREIVGVVGAMRSTNLAQPPAEEIFYPSAQMADGAFQNIAVRSTRPAASLRPELVAAIHSLDAGLPVAEVQPLAEQLSQAIADRRLMMGLLGAFAALALALAGMGIYSVISYGVAQRTNEIGIRMALGAAPGTVVAMVVREGLRLAAIGLGIGLVASVLLTHLMQKLLFDVSATDPMVLGGVSLFLAAIAALACYVPARRATKVDPLIALRAE